MDLIDISFLFGHYLWWLGSESVQTMFVFSCDKISIDTYSISVYCLYCIRWTECIHGILICFTMTLPPLLSDLDVMVWYRNFFSTYLYTLLTITIVGSNQPICLLEDLYDSNLNWNPIIKLNRHTFYVVIVSMLSYWKCLLCVGL